MKKNAFRESMRDLNLDLIYPVDYTGLLDLKGYTYYFEDGTGFIVMAIPSTLFDYAKENNIKNLIDYECAIPCKYVLEKGYKRVDEHIIVNVPYNSDYGIDVDELYYEV